jgi:AraC-like DNA-binding protein
MLTGSRRRAGESRVLASYYPSRVPGLSCSTLFDDGPPKARVQDRFALFTLTAGSAVTWCRGEPQALTPGSVLLLGPGDVHRDVEKTPYSALMVVLHSSVVRRWSSSAREVCFDSQVVRCPTVAAETLALVAAVRAKHQRVVQERSVETLFRALEPFRASAASRREPPLVARARRAFEESSGAALSLDELGGRLRCTPSYACRVFSEYTGLGPHAYQLQLRLLAAARLIENGRSVGAAAALTGFADESHLRRHFSRRFAVPPSRYQAELAPRAQSFRRNRSCALA